MFEAFLSRAASRRLAARERKARLLGLARFPWVSPTAMNIQPLCGWGLQTKSPPYSKKAAKILKLTTMGWQTSELEQKY